MYFFFFFYKKGTQFILYPITLQTLKDAVITLETPLFIIYYHFYLEYLDRQA